MTTEQPGKANMLDYGTRPRGRRLRAVAIVTLALVGLVASFYAFAFAANEWPRYQLRRRHRAMWDAAIARPLAGRLAAFDRDPNRAAGRIADASTHEWSRGPIRAVVLKPPAECAAIESTLFGAPDRWLATLGCFPRDAPLAGRQIVLLHLMPMQGLRAGRTIWTFLITEVRQDPSGELAGGCYFAEALVPPELDDPSRRRLRFFTATPDPGDAGHVTIGYDVDGVPGTIDVALDPRPSVVVRDGPAAIP